MRIPLGQESSLEASGSCLVSALGLGSIIETIPCQSKRRGFQIFCCVKVEKKSTKKLKNEECGA